jgi:signal peptidase I
MPDRAQELLAVSDRVGGALLRAAVRDFGTARVVVRGSSMLPAIEPGDTIVLEPLAPGAVLDDIVMFEWQNRLLAHRIVNIAGTTLTTRGDNHAHVDGVAVDPEQVIGRVTQVLRNGRPVDVTRWARRASGLAPAIARRWFGWRSRAAHLAQLAHSSISER